VGEDDDDDEDLRWMMVNCEDDHDEDVDEIRV